MNARPGDELATLLGGRTPGAFLARHWQKEPLLIRQAVPGFQGFLDEKAVLRLARRRDVPSRLVRKKGGSWRTEEGPLDVDAGRLGPRDWTVLVQSVESIDERGWDLLRRFSFVPRARIDDLMVSYAAPGGGVGPHFDLYDVFLLQGFGRRRWRIKRSPEPPSAEEGEAAPSSPLASFTPDDDLVLEPGDMLYLPPRFAHEGTALEACTTWSIGFLAPTHEALVGEYLAYLGLRSPPAGMYADPDLTPAVRGAVLPPAMVSSVQAVLRRALVTDDDAVEEFVGRLLTAPKPHVVFTPRRRGGSPRGLPRAGEVKLTPPSRALLTERRFFLNGDAYPIDDEDRAFLEELAEARRASLPQGGSSALARHLGDWDRSGFVTVLSR